MDFDAISVLIKKNSDNSQLDNISKKALEKFLLLFGTRISSVHLPFTAVAAGEKNIFSRDGKPCQHLSEDFKEEIQIIDGPVKIATLPSCRQKLVSNLNKNDWPLCESNNSGLCFDHAATPNKPPFGDMIDAITESCFVSDSFFLHVAEIGMRLPMSELKNIFNSISTLREAGFCVEIPQLDIAFSIPILTNNLIQLSCKKGARSNSDPQMNGLKFNSFPLHTLSKARHDTRGTCRWIRDNWPNQPREISLNTSNFLSRGTRQVLRYYRCDDENQANLTPQLKTDLRNSHSVKMYSTARHHLHGLEASKIPYKMNQQMKDLPSLNMSQLKSIIASIVKCSTSCCYAVQQPANNVRLRIEVSIRPYPSTLNKLRHQGHLCDFLAHTTMMIDSIVENHRFKLHLLSPSQVQVRLNSFVQHITPMIRFRDSTQFKSIWRGSRYAEFLQAYMFMMMTTAGIASYEGHLNFLLR